MKSIRSHTHQERAIIIDHLVPIIQKKLGENLLALGVGGSYARYSDAAYSDIELVAFVKTELPHFWEIRKVEDGILIVVTVETKENYISKYLDISDIWYASAADKLKPLINEQVINEINQFKPQNVDEKCVQQINKRWFGFQEITAKTLNMIESQNKKRLPLIFHEMVKELVILLAYLNKTPFNTLGSYLTQSKQFSILPERFDELIELTMNGKYTTVENLDQVIKELFTSCEDIFAQ